MVLIASAHGKVQESRVVQSATCMTNCKNDGLHTGQRCCLKPVSTLLSSAMKLWRLCFYTCLSVILFTGRCLGPHPVGKLRGLAGEGVSRPTPRGEVEGSGLGVGVGVSAQEGGVCPAPNRWLLLRMVCILLEWILVLQNALITNKNAFQ